MRERIRSSRSSSSSQPSTILSLDDSDSSPSASDWIDPTPVLDCIIVNTCPVSPLPIRPWKPRTAQPQTTRTTEYLDLIKPEAQVTAQDRVLIDRLITLLRKKKKIVVIAGAGISVSSGIPDFRSPTGIFARANKNFQGSGSQLFDASVYRHESSTESFHTIVREMAEMFQQAQPTPFHHLLASLSQEGRLLRLYSQNIDCLDTNMRPLETKVPLPTRGPWPITIQLHGSLQKMTCFKCHQVEPFRSELFEGPEPPLCESCAIDDQLRTVDYGKRSHGVGRLRPRFVLYNEFHSDGEAIGNVSAADLKTRPDAVIVVGTSLKVPGTRRLAKEMCQVAHGRKDGLTVWINPDPEPKNLVKDCWDIVVRAECDDVARLAALPPWNCDIAGPDDLLLVSNKDQPGGAKSKIEIILPLSSRNATSLDAPRAIPTPLPNPEPAEKKEPQPETDETAPRAERKKPGRKPKQLAQGLGQQPANSKQATTTTKKKITTTHRPPALPCPVDAGARSMAQGLDLSSHRKRPNGDCALPPRRKRLCTTGTIFPQTKRRGLR